MLAWSTDCGDYPPSLLSNGRNSFHHPLLIPKTKTKTPSLLSNGNIHMTGILYTLPRPKSLTQSINRHYHQAPKGPVETSPAVRPSNVYRLKCLYIKPRICGGNQSSLHLFRCLNNVSCQVSQPMLPQGSHRSWL